jgi:hypothetical protein
LSFAVLHLAFHATEKFSLTKGLWRFTSGKSRCYLKKERLGTQIADQPPNLQLGFIGVLLFRI